MNLKLNYDITNDLDFKEDKSIFDEDGFLTFERDVERVMSLIYSNMVDLSVEDKFVTSIYGKEATKERFYFKLTATLMQEEKYDVLYFNYIKDFTRDFINTYEGLLKDGNFNVILFELKGYLERRLFEIPEYITKRNQVKNMITSFSVNTQPDGVINAVSLLNHYYNADVLERFMDSTLFNAEASVLENVSKFFGFSSDERFAFNKLIDQEAEMIRQLIKHVVLRPIKDNLDSKYYEMTCTVLDEFIMDQEGNLSINDVDTALLAFGKAVLEKILDNDVVEYVNETKGLIIRH